MNNNIKAVRLLVQTREDFQSMRKAIGNRLGLKANNEQQDVDDRIFQEDDLEAFGLNYKEAKSQEGKIERQLVKVLQRFDIYNHWLCDVRGVGPISAGWIIGWIDIEKATTVSKIWQYCGLNPNTVMGKKAMSLAEAEKSGLPIVRKYEGRDGEDLAWVQTSDPIRGDRLTAGYVAPFNKRLRTALVGVMADGFIKGGSPYRKFYDDYKHRLESRADLVLHAGKEKPWSEVSKGHRHRAAMRYMVKMFLADLYAAWRAIEGLEVREPYQAEKLGHKHNAA